MTGGTAARAVFFLLCVLPSEHAGASPALQTASVQRLEGHAVAGNSSAEPSSGLSERTRSLLASARSTYRNRWPVGSTIQIGTAEPFFDEVIAQAGLPYTRFSITVPSSCVTAVTQSNLSQASPQYEVVAHVHHAALLEVSVSVKASGRAHLFLGTSLADGYQVVLDDVSGVSSVQRRDSVSLYSGTSLLDGGNSVQKFWISYHVSGGNGVLRVGRGTTIDSSQLMHLFDDAPPDGASEALYLWAATVEGILGEWRVCSLRRGEPALHTGDQRMPMVKVVRAAARDSDCESTDYDVPMLDTEVATSGTGGVPASVWPLRLYPTSEQTLSTGSTMFKFMHGGRYKMCYDPDASNSCICVATICTCTIGFDSCTTTSRPHGSCNPFESADSLPSSKRLPEAMPLFADVLVRGVGSSCNTDDCIAAERWDCYFGLLGENNGPCRFDFTVESGRLGWVLHPGYVSRMTWTAAYPPDSIWEGVAVATYPEACGAGSTPAANFDGAPEPPTFELWARKGGVVSMPRVRSDISEPFSVTVCYCPDVATSPQAGACQLLADYVQPFGRLYFWTLHLCDYSDPFACPRPYLRVAPQQKFVIKILCPPGDACAAGTGNRIKFLDPRGLGPKYSNWDGGGLCQLEMLESGRAIWPYEASSLNLDGGVRSDFKIWSTELVRLDISVGHALEVCYCNDNCGEGMNWIQVGRVRALTEFAYASKTHGRQDGTEIRTLTYVNKPGSFTLFGGIHSDMHEPLPSPWDSNKYSGEALLNLLSFDRVEVDGMTLEDRYHVNLHGLEELYMVLDRECKRQIFSDGLVEGLSSARDAADHIARVSFNTRQVDRYLPFAGPDQDRPLTATKAGTLAACYCTMVADGLCLRPHHWVFVGLLQIRGPRGGQEWVLPTKMVVRIAGIQGWGFDPADRLRILAAGESACTNDGHDPQGNIDFQLSCPAASGPVAPCQQASQNHLIASSLIGSSTTGILIESIRVESARSSVLSFTGPVSHHLQEGDAITINPSSVLVSGKTQPHQTQAERYDVYTLAGMSPFGDDASTHFFKRWHRVRYLDPKEDGSASVSGRVTAKLRIPIGWDTNRAAGVPSFSFLQDSNENQWVRRSLMDTSLEIRSDVAMQQLKLCWGPLDQGYSLFYADAGVVTFADPEAMEFAAVSLTTRQAGAVAPVVLSFTINRGYRIYETVAGEMVLTLRFRGSELIPAYSDGAIIGAADFVPSSNMSQVVCGELFLELWSNDERGFPMPKGCYLNAAGASGGVAENGDPAEQDIFVVFDRFNGLRNFCDRPSDFFFCHYQVVMNARAAEFHRDSHAVDVYTGCRYESGGCLREFEFYERGEALATPGTLEAASEWQGMLDRVAGFQLQEVDENGVRHLAPDQAFIQAQLRASSESTGINRSSILRIFLAPLTRWDVGSSPCVAQCLTSDEAVCSGEVACAREQVVPGESQNHNVLKITLPLGMDSIVGSVSHTIRIDGLVMPSAVFFPARLGVQLSSPVDDALQYVLSRGHVAYVDPGASTADGRLLLTSQSGGGPNPFPGATNALYVRLQFGATLWAHGAQHDSSPAALEISLPPGYTCYVEGSGKPPHVFDRPGLFTAYSLMRETDAFYNNTASTLFLLDRNRDDHADFPRGILSAVAPDGSWSASIGQRSCVYTLQAGQALFPGQVVYFRALVENPSNPMQRSAEANTWSVQMRSRGTLESGGPYSSSSTPFSYPAASEADLWAQNAAVLGELQNVLVQPADFALGAAHYLTIYFTTFQEIASGGAVIVDAPTAFAFMHPCSVRLLDGAAYDVADAPGSVRPLPDIGDCQADPGPNSEGVGTNRARIRLLGRLIADRTYAFQLRVQNPDHLPLHGCSWYLWTADPSGYVVDGSPKHPALAPGFATCWRLYGQAWPQAPALQVQGGFLHPYRVFRRPDVLVATNIRIPADRDGHHTDMRVIPPPSCLFREPSAGGFHLSAAGSTADLPHTPKLGSAGELLWLRVHLQSSQVYGFEAAMEVRDTQALIGTHTFSLELGFAEDDLAARIGAVTAAAPPLRAVVAAPVDYLSSRAGFRRNVLVFHFRLASEVPPRRDAALVIRGREGLRGSGLACWATEASAISAQLPADVTCHAGVDTLGAPFLRLQPGFTGISAGAYSIRVQASNPVIESATDVTWSIGTFFNVSDSLEMVQIDAPAAAVGFPLRTTMHSATLAWEAMGDHHEDRPGRVSTIIIFWRLALAYVKQPAVPELLVRAPHGFSMPDDCLSGVNISTQSESDLRSVGWRFASNESVPVSTCMASGSTFVLALPSGLDAHREYALRLSVVNPREPPSLNFWALEYAALTSEPLSGFPLAIITFIAPLAAVSIAAGLGEAAPVSIAFMVQKAVPPGGKLLLAAPASFTVHNATALRRRRTSVDVLVLTGTPPRAVSQGAALAVEVDDEGVPAGVPYLLQVFVTNPADVALGQLPWSMASSDASGAPLDEGEVTGYPLYRAAQLHVENVAGDRYSLHPVTIKVHVASPEQMLFGDVVRLQAPDGFALVGSKPSACAGFKWLAWLSPAPRPVPVCACNYGPCVIDMALEANLSLKLAMRGLAYNASQSLEFQLSSANAARDPEIEQRYWRILHLRPASAYTQVLSAAVQRSWHIQPLLQEPAVQLVGMSQAAGAESSFVVTFVPVSVADVAWLVAEFPYEVSFDGASLDAPQQKDERSSGPNLIVSGLKLDVGVKASIFVKSVRLGRGGGRSIFSLATYRTTELKEKIDENLHFEGFYQPGRAELTGELRSFYALQPERYPVRSGFPARAGEDGEATFELVFSYAVSIGDHIVLSSEGDGAYYFFADARSTLFFVSLDGTSQERATISPSRLSDHKVSVLVVSVETQPGAAFGAVVLEPGQLARLSMWLTPTLGINSLRVETHAGTELTNTNDGNSLGFAPVAKLKALVQAQRSPPRTTVDVLLQVSFDLVSSNIVVPELVLVAPPEFSFPEDCGDICTSRGETFGQTGQAIATLTSAGSTTLLGLELHFLVNTPDRTPLVLLWLVQALGLNNELVGWGSVDSFKVNQMRDTAVYYGGIPNGNVRIAFTFSFMLEPGDDMFTIIDVTSPKGFVMSCKEDLEQVSLPGGKPVCESDGPGQMRLVLNETLRARSYAFAAMAELPSTVPSLPVFAVAIRERGTEDMVDAAFDVPGWLLRDLQVTQPSLAWSTAGYGELSSVTVTFTLNNDTAALLSFLIALPPGFHQRVRGVVDVKSSNAKLPLMKGGQDWIDASLPRQLRILLEPGDPIIAAGSYRFTFPVIMPETSAETSPVNLWYLLLCQDRSCSQASDVGTLVSFALAGFLPGQISALEQHRLQVATGYDASAADRSPRRPSWLLVLELLLCLVARRLV